jgi:hypothetical protein
MTSGDLELVELVISFTVGVVGSAVVIVLDERRLSGAELERAWPTTSRNVAIYAFSPICVFLHFVRTRRDLRGSDFGLLWLAAIVLLDNGLQLLARHAIEWLGV